MQKVGTSLKTGESVFITENVQKHHERNHCCVERWFKYPFKTLFLEDICNVITVTLRSVPKYGVYYLVLRKTVLWKTVEISQQASAIAFRKNTA